MTKDNKQQLEDMINKSKRIVFFGGAGVSTESGIPDFRGSGGLYNKQGEKFAYPAEQMLSHEFLQYKPELFFEFYRSIILQPQAQPNPAHLRLARLEEEGRLLAVITQNIDGLHQAAGSRQVLELHGSVYRNYCTGCQKAYELADILKKELVPLCTCGSMIRPDVVLYGEQLDDSTVNRALKALQRADLLIVGGTSLSVYPAAGFVSVYQGPLVIINMSPTGLDEQADLLLRLPIGQALAI